MIKFIVLSSLVALALAGTTTITTTITTSANGETTVTTSTTSDTPDAPADGAPTAAEIALVRETFPLIKSNSEIHARMLLDHFKYHPETQKLFPKFANVPLAELPNHPAFKQQAFSCMVFGLNFIVNNLDNPKLLAAQLQRVESYNKWYVNYMSEDRQLKETVRITVNVMGEVLGARLSPEAKAAWEKALNYAFSFMGTDKAAPASGKSVLSASELAAARAAWDLMKDNVKVAESALIKHFVLHPPVQALIPGLADLPISEMQGNDLFHAIAHTSMRITNYLINNLDNDELLSAVLAKITVGDYFVDYMDPIYQLDETTRLFLEAAREELGSALSAEAEAALKKGLDHIHDLMAAVATNAVNGAALDTTVKRQDESAGLPTKTKEIIRDTWALARRNADISPKLFLKMFAAHPETQKMFPRFAKVPVAELRKNKYFQQQVYNCMFGLTVIIKNLDTPDIVATLLKNMAAPSFYVTGPSAAAQLDETTRLFNEAMAEELGAVYTPEVQSAFTDLLNWVHGILAKANDDDGVPTAQDKQIIRDNINILKAQKSNYGAKTILKLIKAHPDSIKLFPKFANMPLNELEKNPEFLAYGNVFSAGLNFMIDNIDDPTAVKHILSGKDASKYFVPGVSIRQQLEETFRVAIEAIGEELGPRFTPKTRRAFTRGLRFLNQVQDDSFNFEL